MKKITFILSLFIILFTLKGTAQSPNWQWATSGTGTGNESVSRVRTDNSGNIIVGGLYVAPMTLDGTTVTTQANTTTIPFFAGDLFIAKYNSSGSLLWVVVPTGVGDHMQSSVIDIITDPSGNIFAHVNFSPADSISGVVFGNDTIYSKNTLLKFDPSGNLLWHQALGEHWVASLATDASGNLYMETHFAIGTMSATFDTVTVTNPNPIIFGEIIIVKFNGSGSALWAKTAGGIGRDMPVIILTDNSGNLYLTGSYESDTMFFDASTYLLATTPPAPSSNPADYFYAKYDSNGNLIWAKSILLANMGSTPYGEANLKPAVNNNGELFFAGRNIASSLNIGTITLNSPGYFVTKMDVNGDPVWATAIGDTLDRDPADLQLDGFGNLYVLGSFNSDSILMANTWLYNVSPGSGTRDLLVAMVDANGSPTGVFKEGGDDNDAPAFKVNANSSMYLSGSFKSNTLTFGSTTLNNPNFPSNHMFLTYSTPILTGLNDLELSESFSIYPNPATAEINLQIKNIAASSTTVSILNTLGEIVYSKAISNQLNSTIDVSGLPSGVYVMQIQNKNDIASGKFIKY